MSLQNVMFSFQEQELTFCPLKYVPYGRTLTGQVKTFLLDLSIEVAKCSQPTIKTIHVMHKRDMRIKFGLAVVTKLVWAGINGGER